MKMKVKNRLKIIALFFFGWIISCLIVITSPIQFVDFLINGKNRVFDFLQCKLELGFDKIYFLKQNIC